ncbi:MAG TPA: 6-carboxytetrahydropterin synthase [Oligoflexus sp.]|uniref:6-pyruvoyl trahydropterin synthase family protein n=1 Tax=Oligoflexus sp. TaxID=1971216 RepID=UPI002D61C05B|nr:6-carboxytetrahydropterin synthase [Oligoflexus sp.]HYX34034.1 6-carboxytetrahydropterin synthase [Oligoflexus sp.]
MEEKTAPQSGKERFGRLFINDVDKIDCAIFDPSVGVVGQSWYVDITVSGQLDSNGFVYDFSHLKKLVKQVLKSSLDHTLIIPVQSKLVHYQETDRGELWRLQAKSRLTGVNSEWSYLCPKGAVYPIRSVQVTREIVEQECSRLVRHRLPEEIHSVEIHLRKEEERAGYSFFRYSHGITGHEGLCQRLFHGHRSVVEVYVADERRHDLEQWLAHEVLGSIVHIASMSQLVNPAADLRPGVRSEHQTPLTIAYEASKGHYEATVPANRVFLVEGETSIESIAQELARLIGNEGVDLGVPIKVKCFEGIGKGAIAEL